MISPPEHDTRKVRAIQGADWRQISLRTWSTVTKSEIWAHCASVGFFGFLSVFPMMAVFVLIYGLAFSPADMEAQVAYLRPFVPTAVYELLAARLQDLATHRTSQLTTGLIFSTLAALYMGSRGIKYLIVLVNLACHKTSTRGFLRRFALAFALTLAALFIVITALSALAAVPLLTAQLPFPHTAERLALWGRWPLLAGLIFCSFLSLFCIAPNGERARLRCLAPGAALATALWLLLSALFSVYVQYFGNYGATFGTLSAGVVLMLWIYYSAFIIAVGAALNFEIEFQTYIDTDTDTDALHAVVWHVPDDNGDMPFERSGSAGRGQ